MQSIINSKILGKGPELRSGIKIIHIVGVNTTSVPPGAPMGRAAPIQRENLQ